MIAKLLSDQVKACQRQVQEVSKINPEEQINKIQRKQIKEVVVEMLTPVQRNMNVDFKQLKKVIEDCMKGLKEHQEKIYKQQKQIDDANVTLMRQLKNTDNDKHVLNRELNRMQRIDRLKVFHAKDSFFNPDTGRFLPSLDTAHASGSILGNP